jgi:hypothetical protein
VADDVVSEQPQLAYIISAYRNLGQLGRLVRRISSDRSIVVVHVDRKTDDGEYDDLVARLTDVPSVHFLERHACHWGGFGHVRATLKGTEELLRRSSTFQHVILLTGQDYPLKSNHVLERFFHENRGRSFMAYSPLPSPWWSPRGGRDRIEYRHVRWRGRHVQLPGRRSFPRGLRPFGGGAYWCLSRECIELVHSFVRERPDVVRFFHRVDIPDEIFFQTVVMNSDLAGTVVNDNLRYIDWSRDRRPAVLGIEDLERLRTSTKLFARKFDVGRDPAILDAIDRELLDVAKSPAQSN